MTGSFEQRLPIRPEPPRQVADRVLTWLRWFGFARLIGAAASVLVVGVGAVWLLQAPPAPAEATLPVVAGGNPTTATLPPPSTVAAPATASTTPATIIVHVAGAVQRPGVVVLTGSARVIDAVVAAGGAASEGDLDGLNLAATLADGQRVYVPAIGEVDPASVPSGGAAGSGAPGAGTNPALSNEPPGPVDLNVATEGELDALPGVGPATAAAIVDDRTRNGPFASVDDLDRVPGIGPAKLATLAPLVTV